MNKIFATIPAHDTPAWIEEFSSALHYADHLVLSGNIRDRFPHWEAGVPEFPDLLSILSEQMKPAGIDGCLIYDPVSGLRLTGDPGDQITQALDKAGVALGDAGLSLAQLGCLHAEITRQQELPVAFVIDYASHLHGQTPAQRAEFFVQIDKDSRGTEDGVNTRLRRNPTIWLADHASDLPDWFVCRNDLLRQIHVDLPNLEDRFICAQSLLQDFDMSTSGDDTATAQEFALQCDGETLIAMRSIARIAQAEKIGFRRISDAIRIYRTGIRRNPWNSKVLSDRVRNAKELLHKRIKGQDAALDKTLDILARSIVGLSGAQSGSRLMKPRGVMFLAGPTGVGKTELAKAVTELLFGDETACHRFDMSEFMEESSVSRLIGAPPGHPGHERGGELVNAAHRRPFSVFLFDEVEKAHPRVLDVFLQVLDEGRLTDSRGETAYFSESLIIFTSNIGMIKGARTTNLGLNALPSDTHEELETKVGNAIWEHFVSELRRPELLNRIGQNVVVFDFLCGDAAYLIFDAMLQRVLRAVSVEQGITVEVSETARDQLRSLCTSDYFGGGRGIGNQIERHLINPLSRQIFEQGITRNFRIADVTSKGGKTKLVLEPQPADRVT